MTWDEQPTNEEDQQDLERVCAQGCPVVRIEPSAFPAVVHHSYINRCEVCGKEFDAGSWAAASRCIPCHDAWWQQARAEMDQRRQDMDQWRANWNDLCEGLAEMEEVRAQESRPKRKTFFGLF